ncbi:MAG: ribosomal protein S18-alanine N-acetyltransferase [Sandaracinaceae bacterium]|nr:ribosomal protein S18-alanine N-acetyltransferase [Sandaracinaceae bacterium]
MREADVPHVVAIDRSGEGSSAWDEAQLRGELGRNWAHLWVARRSEVPVAFVATWHVADELHVLNVATHAQHRRRGHARRLLEHALAFAAERAVRLVLLEVRRSNAAAIGLYRAFGFVAMGVRERYYSDDEDAVEMLLRLDEAGRPVPSVDEVTL